jgi:hypothetical protein
LQRIRIEGLKKDPWFCKNYVPVGHKEDEKVNLDDVRAVFDDIEVGCCFSFSMYDCLSHLIQKFSNGS